MSDLNYFSVLKKQKQRSQSIRNMALAALAILLIVNLAAVGLGMIAFSRLNGQISQSRAFIDSTDTKARVSEVQALNKEATIAQDYLVLLQSVATKISKTDRIKLELIDYIRGADPGLHTLPPG